MLRAVKSPRHLVVSAPHPHRSSHHKTHAMLVRVAQSLDVLAGDLHPRCMPIAPDFSTFMAQFVWDLVLLLAKMAVIVVAITVAAAFAVVLLICTGRLQWYVRRYL